ncbi:DEAD/DEAH box helicase family protein [Aestuariibaculum sp. M13]|uniref:TnsA endonuclease N-terminal domain-containing protein n=1 Tax=Aestuariibaculum sp. M13 TaxID=2967132 RepID=UPI00215A04FC|nr:TnsA endonuclease N-terminal domain-containing protein [Aestuariibaculum sp. M13]MCR8667945.1 DEAD/DEAH box helicase family protein [Aestuariibaculum sp. M13]
MAKKKTNSDIDFPFYTYLKLFHDNNKKKVYNSYKPLTKKFLDFNNPENPTAYLRQPQFEALEMYVFLKEFLENNYLYEVFENWFNKTGKFEKRDDVGISKTKGTVGTLNMFGPSEFQNEDKLVFNEVFKQIESFKQIYPNYIFALTMGLGKTVLMATSIFYEFLLANKYPKTNRYCHNALVFAPDKTVLQSLKEIETFDKSKVIPPEYANWLDTHLKFHFLDDTGVSLNALDNSKFNIIISNTQKIILKKQHKQKSPSESLFNDGGALHKAKSLNKDFEDLYGFEIDTDVELLSNQRFAKLTRLKQLGIYVDEAHHVFGTNLAKDFGLKKTSTSLRVTINELAEALDEAGSRVVGCYNYTGTPYVGKRLLPEVVYAYGLKEAIDNKFLKKVRIEGFENVKTQTKAFVRAAISEFWEKHNGKRYEGMLPKFAFFASSIDELQNELRPIIEDILVELNIPINKILVNVGDDKITSNDDLREFRNLDRPESNKQFILLVNKGKEGWNCRSLFGVGLHREPKSKVFVLQAAMRCLRAVTEVQQEGMVYLSDENIKILENELEQNFKLSVDELTSAGDSKDLVEIRLVPPPVKIKVKRIKKLHQLKENKIKDGVNLEIDKIDFEAYKIRRTVRDIRDLSDAKKNGELTDIDKREFSEYTLVSEIARYLYHPEGVDNLSKISCLEIRKVLTNSVDGIKKVLEAVNKHNEVLYDWVIPKLFNSFYTIDSFNKEEEEEIELVKEPKEGFYRMKAKAELIANIEDPRYSLYKEKSFHLDNYCFDSLPESSMFTSLLKDEVIEKVWFTGMLTHGQSDFLIRYIDPESHTVRSYYPDFLVKVKTEDNSEKYVIIEVKGDNKIDDAVVKAKSDYASQLATASGMTYQIVKGSEAANGIMV